MSCQSFVSLWAAIVIGLFSPTAEPANAQMIVDASASDRCCTGSTLIHEAGVLVSDWIVPQFVNGGGWSTTIRIVNLGTTRARVDGSIWHGDGSPFSVNFVFLGRGSAFHGDLDPGESIVLETDGQGQLEQGWASVVPADRQSTQIAGFATFRQTVPGRPDFEAVVPFSNMFEKRFVMFFDNTMGASTGIALVNADSQVPLTANFKFRDPKGNLFFEDNIQLAPANQAVFSVPDRFPSTRGRTGTIVVSSSTTVLSGLGLRFIPGGAFTSFHTLTNVELLR